jgi:ribonuclease HI
MWATGWIWSNQQDAKKKVPVWIKCEVDGDAEGGSAIVVNAQQRALVKYHVSPEARVYDARPESLVLRPKTPAASWKKAPVEDSGDDASAAPMAPDWQRHAATVPDFFLADSDDEDVTPRVSLPSLHVKKEPVGLAYYAGRDRRGNPSLQSAPGNKNRNEHETTYPPTSTADQRDSRVYVKTEENYGSAEREVDDQLYAKADDAEDANEELPLQAAAYPSRNAPSTVAKKNAKHDETSRPQYALPPGALGSTILGKRQRLPVVKDNTCGRNASVGTEGGECDDKGIGGEVHGERRAAKKQKETATVQEHQADASALINNFPDNTILCWTDGSSHGNPGPAGAGAVVCVPSSADAKLLKGRARLLSTCQVGDARGGLWLEGWHALGKATSNVGELSAIDLALDIGAQARRTHAHLRPAPIKILTDSRYSQGALGQNQARKNVALIKSIRPRIVSERATVHWVKGHAGVPGNVRADELAAQGSVVSRQELQRAIEQNTAFCRIKTVTNVAHPSPN